MRSISQVEASVGRQRYKGLGDMDPKQLWETTMDPTVHHLLKVQIDAAIEVNKVFTMPMGEEVELRRDFIQTHLLIEHLEQCPCCGRVSAKLLL